MTSLYLIKTSDEEDNHQVAWEYLRLLLSKYHHIDLAKYTISINENGKPSIEPIFFNISHSYHQVLIVISSESCGVDIEYHRKRNIEKLANYIMQDDEKVEFNKANDKDEFFYSLWVKKESYIKKIGSSIAKIKGVNISNINFYSKTLSFNQELYSYALCGDVENVKVIEVERY